MSQSYNVNSEMKTQKCLKTKQAAPCFNFKCCPQLLAQDHNAETYTVIALLHIRQVLIATIVVSSQLMQFGNSTIA